MMISIVIPAREEEKAIAETIRQFEKLSIPHEIIVSDGTSSDRTVEVARTAGARVVENADGIRSPAHQRNMGAKAATGAYILFVDVTVKLPDIETFMARALSHFESDPNVAALAVPQWIYPELATTADRIALGITNFIIGLQKMGSGKFMLIRREAFERAHGFNENLMTREDGDLFIRLKSVGRVVFDKNLYITYSGRRERAWGWPRLLYVWLRDTAAVVILGKSLSKDWTPVR